MSEQRVCRDGVICRNFCDQSLLCWRLDLAAPKAGEAVDYPAKLRQLARNELVRDYPLAVELLRLAADSHESLAAQLHETRLRIADKNSQISALGAQNASMRASVFSLSEANDMLLARAETAEERVAGSGNAKPTRER